MQHAISARHTATPSCVGRRHAACALLAVGLLTLAATAQAARLALVMGNDGYRNIRGLDNARADAQSVAVAAERAGYSVDLQLDRTHQ